MSMSTSVCHETGQPLQRHNRSIRLRPQRRRTKNFGCARDANVFVVQVATRSNRCMYCNDTCAASSAYQGCAVAAVAALLAWARVCRTTTRNQRRRRHVRQARWHPQQAGGHPCHASKVVECLRENKQDNQGRFGPSNDKNNTINQKYNSTCRCSPHSGTTYHWKKSNFIRKCK